MFNNLHRKHFYLEKLFYRFLDLYLVGMPLNLKDILVARFL